MQLLSGIAPELVERQEDQLDAVFRQYLLAAVVVDAPLLGSRDAADRGSSVHDGNRFGVLPFAVFDDQI